MEDCLFCKISRKEVKAAIVSESEETLAFLDVHPCAPGHTVIVSKTHSSTLVDLPPEKLYSLFLTVQQIDELLLKSLQAAGMTIGINQGAVAGQSIDHLHIHCIPRWKEDGGKSIHSIVRNPSDQSAEEILQKIKQKT